MDGPGTNFLLAGGEVALEAEQVIRGVRQPIESRLGEAERGKELRAILGRQLGKLRLDLGGEGHDFGRLAVGGERRDQRGHECVAAPDLLLAHVGRVQHRL